MTLLIGVIADADDKDDKHDAGDVGDGCNRDRRFKR